MEKKLMNNTTQNMNTAINSPNGSHISTADYSNLVKPTANYFGAGLNSLTSYLDD